MTFRVNETDHDHIPEEFTVESLKEAGFEDAEIELLSQGEDPIVNIEDPEAEAGKAAADDPAKAEVGTPPAEEGDIADQATGEDDAAAQQAAADAAASQQAADDAAAAAEVEDPAMPQIPDTSEAEAKIAAGDEALEALLTKYDDGDLTSEEYREQQKAIIAEQTQAQAIVTAAENAVQQAVQSQQQHWYNRLEAYKKAAPDLWNDDHLAGWDRQLRAVTGNQAYADLSRDAQIKMAHRLYAAEYEARNGKPLEIAPPAAKGEARAEDKGPEEKLEVKKGEKPKAPQTLADFNSDTSAEVEDSRFAAIDRQIMKDPIGAENAFDSMTPEQQERFLEEV
ncbi:hypothetical protein [Sulfitobacter sp. R18_1]|uniref:hypothetical protein n=1 Tax=Sulfitobacter sp. R18_1 TaxID=2821104 RepID=UPI001ADA0A08|nr:hypothetical protein [Sulfitobacter sp. R18_1]MBO9430616.1 hypothetical protein [Sulfitobacter sp. R18_1]